MLVLITVFLGSLSGCGDSADPLGTGILQFYDVTNGNVITSVTVDPGGSLTLVVRVMNLRSDGTLAPVIGERVTFTLLTPLNGGGLLVVNDRTAGNGQAMALYMAGNNFAIDSVRATTGAGAIATLTINKTGGIVGARISSLAASSTSVADGETSIITANVTDGNNNPMMGEPVTFTIPTNDSNAFSSTRPTPASPASSSAPTEAAELWRSITAAVDRRMSMCMIPSGRPLRTARRTSS